MKSINNKGISLVELLVAVALLAISGTMLFYGFVTSARVHTKTVDLQMAEDVAQQVSEEFRSHSLSWLKTAYTADPPAVGDTSGKVTFTNVAFNYKVNADKGREDAKFFVDVILTPKDTSKDAAEEVRTTTYRQNQKGASDNFYYDVTDKVGTNTFIMPQITNIYDGKNVVVSDEINQYDNRVAGDLYYAISSQLQKYNKNTTAATAVSLPLFDAAFNMRFGDFSNLKSFTGASVKKKTEITVHQQEAALTDKYVYSVKISYTFKFDSFPLYNGMYVPLGDLNTGSFVNSGATNNLAAVDGADSSLKIYRSGQTYEVIYEKALTDITGFLGAGVTINGSFGDVLNPVKGTDVFGNKQYMFDYKVRKEEGGVLPDEEVPIANLYILYTPFDVYSDGESTDEVIFKIERHGGSKNIVRVFLTIQDTHQADDVNKIMTVKDCKIDGTYDATTFKVYTNSNEVIANKTDSKIDENYYLTNAYGKSITNFYDMQIIVKSYDGTDYYKVAELNTVKED